MIMTDLENSILHLLCLTRLNLLGSFLADILEFSLIVRDTLFQLWDVIASVLVPAVKHVAYTDKRIPLSLQVFKNTFFPSSGFVF